MVEDAVPVTSELRDVWVDYKLNPLPRELGITLVPEVEKAFDLWLNTVLSGAWRKGYEDGLWAEMEDEEPTNPYE